MSKNISSVMKAIWKKMSKKAYRDAYIASHLSNTVASQISSMREDRGLTQKDLAKLAGMKQSRISALEDPNYGNFEFETLKRIASALDVGLTVKFSAFSEVLEWSVNITDSKLKVPAYEKDSIKSVETVNLDIWAAVSFDDVRISAPTITTGVIDKLARQVVFKDLGNSPEPIKFTRPSLGKVTGGAFAQKLPVFSPAMNSSH